MSVAERIQNDALMHLNKARQSMKKLVTCTADWSSGLLLENEFDNIEDVCKEFGQCQFGHGIHSVGDGIHSAPTHEKA